MIGIGFGYVTRNWYSKSFMDKVFVLNQVRQTKTKAAIAQWIRLRLPSCRPELAHHLRFYHL